MKISYSVGIKRPCGWRSAEVIATAEKISDKMVVVTDASIARDSTANRQSFYAPSWERMEIGKKKRLSSVKILEA